MASFSSDGKALFKLCMCVHIHKCVSSYTFFKRRWTFLTGSSITWLKAQALFLIPCMTFSTLLNLCFSFPTDPIGIVGFPVLGEWFRSHAGSAHSVVPVEKMIEPALWWASRHVVTSDYVAAFGVEIIRVVVVTKWDTASRYWVLSLLQRLPHGNHSRHSLAYIYTYEPLYILAYIHMTHMFPHICIYVHTQYIVIHVYT